MATADTKHRFPSTRQYALRSVHPEDRDVILEIRNKDHVRIGMLNPDVITKETHEKWFAAMLQAADKKFYIFSANGQTEGVLGFYDIVQDSANWSFYLADPSPPQSLGTIMCVLGLETGFETHGITGIRTSVLRNNVKSRKLHQKLGFEVIDDDKTHNFIGFHLKKDVWNEIKHTFL